MQLINFDSVKGVNIMDFTTLSEHFVVVVLLACLIIGYLLKHSFTIVNNKYIPTILVVVGAILNGVVSGVSIESIVYGAFMGLASTGMHQAFKQYIEKNEE